MTDDKHLATLRDYYKRVGAFPSAPRLCEVVGLSSTSSVFALNGRLSAPGTSNAPTVGWCRPRNSSLDRP